MLSIWSFLMAVMAFRIFTSLAVSSASKGKSRANSYSAFLIVSVVRSLWSVSIVLVFYVCLRRINLTVSFLRNNFFRRSLGISAVSRGSLGFHCRIGCGLTKIRGCFDSIPSVALCPVFHNSERTGCKFGCFHDSFSAQ